MPQLTELQRQADVMQAITQLTQTAIGYGAVIAPMWIVDRGIPTATFTFPEQPKGCEMDPWRLAIGAHSVSRRPFPTDKGPYLAQSWEFRYHGSAMQINVTYPEPAEVSV